MLSWKLISWKLIRRIKTVIIRKHLLISLNNFFIINIVQVINDTVRTVSVVSVDQGRGDDEDSVSWCHCSVTSHTELMSQVQAGPGQSAIIVIGGHCHCPSTGHIHCPGGGQGGHMVSGPRRCSWRRVLSPLVHTPASGIHEEIGDCWGVQTKLSCNSDLHLFARPLGFLWTYKLFKWTDTEEEKSCCRLLVEITVKSVIVWSTLATGRWSQLWYVGWLRMWHWDYVHVGGNCSWWALWTGPGTTVMLWYWSLAMAMLPSYSW